MKMKWKVVFNWHEFIGPLWKKKNRQHTLKVGSRVSTPFGPGVVHGGALHVMLDKHKTGQHDNDRGVTVGLASIRADHQH